MILKIPNETFSRITRYQGVFSARCDMTSFIDMSTHSSADQAPPLHTIKGSIDNTEFLFEPFLEAWSSAKQCFWSGSGSGGSGTFWVEVEAIFENWVEAEAEAEAILKKKMEAEAEANLKKIWVEAEEEAIFFSLWKRKRKLFDFVWRVEANAEAVEKF